MKVILVAYNNDSYISYFPLGIAYIAAVLRNNGHEVTIYNQDLYHYPEHHLVDYLNSESFDMVGVGMCGGYYQYHRLDEISKAIRQVKRKPLYVLGGHLVSPDPWFFIKKMGADVVVVGEAEKAMLDFCNAKDKHNLRTPLVIGAKKHMAMENIPLPAWDLFPMDYYALMRCPHAENSDRCFPVLTGRGCPYRCNFCYRLDPNYRPREIADIVEEIKLLKERYRITYIDFADELFMTHPKRVLDLCEALKPLKIKFMCNGRLNFAKPHILKAMKEAGCEFINYGIESYNDDMLEVMNKHLTVKEIKEGIKNTLDAGISPGFNIIWGNIGETKEHLWNGVNFLIEYDDHAQLRTIRPVTPYPNSDLYKYAVEKGMLTGIEDFYNKHTNSDLLTVNFTDLTDDEYYEELKKANKVLIENYYKAQSHNLLGQTDKLYDKKDASFRGYRQI